MLRKRYRVQAYLWLWKLQEQECNVVDLEAVMRDLWRGWCNRMTVWDAEAEEAVELLDRDEIHMYAVRQLVP